MWDVAARQRPPAGPDGRASRRPGSGSSTTLLPDGRSLIVGGERTEARAWLWDPQTRTTVAIGSGPQAPRAWHSATVLADGTVLVLGCRNGGALVETPEVFDPATSAFTPFPIVGAVARATDGDAPDRRPRAGGRGHQRRLHSAADADLGSRGAYRDNGQGCRRGAGRPHRHVDG
jgi:hypothetical protein